MKKPAILFLIFVSLVAFVYYYEIEGKEKRDEAKQAEESLVRLKQDEITALEIIRPGQEPILLRKEGENWVVKKPIETSADKFTVESLLRNIETARIERSFDDGSRRARDYGLDRPRLTLKVRAKEQEKVLHVGRDDYTGSQLYVQVQGNPKIHLTYDSLLTTADKDLLQWRNKKVLALERDKVQAIEMVRPSEKVVLRKEGEKWLLRSPLEEAADRDTVSGLLSALEFAEAQKFMVEKTDDLKAYGLDKPAVMVRLQEQGQDNWKTLELGKKQGGEYLARNPDRSPVFTVKEEVYEKLTQKIWELRDKDVVEVAQDEVTRLVVRRGTEEIVIHHSEMKWTVEKPQEQKGKEALSYKFWYPIDDIKFESIDDQKAESDGFVKPDVQVIVTLKDKSTRTYEFIRKGDRYLARRRDSGRQGTISKESFEKLQFKASEIV